MLEYNIHDKKKLVKELNINYHSVPSIQPPQKKKYKFDLFFIVKLSYILYSSPNPKETP